MQRGRWRRLGSVLVLGVALACSSAEERFATHVQRGEEYEAAGETAKALLEYNSALKIDPEAAEINERVGDILQAQRSGQDAAYYYREAYRLDASRVEAAVKEARIILRDDPRRARVLLDEVLERDPDNAFAHRIRAELLLTRGNTERALEYARRTTELAPEDPASWMELGKIRQGQIRAAQVAKREPDEARFREALEAFQRADEVAGGYVNARLEQARTYGAWRGHGDDARRTYREAVELALRQDDPRMKVVAGEAAAEFASLRGEPELEAWALRRVVEVAPGRLSAWRRLADLAEAEEGGARSVYREMLAMRPSDPLAQITYANYLIASGNSAGAIAHLEHALEDGVEAPLMWEQLMLLRLRARQLAEARAAFVQMADAFPDAPITRRAEARLALVTGRIQEATQLLRALVSEDESLESLNLLAQAEFQLGDMVRAAAAVDRAIALSSGFPRELMNLKAKIHARAKEWRAVLGVYREIVARKLPLSPRDRVTRAVALYETGRSAAGRNELMRALAEPEPLVSAAIEFARREGESQPEAARAHLETAFQRHPSHAGVLEELTNWDLRRGDSEAALARVDEVVKSQRVKPGVLMLRAELLAQQAAWEAAEADALRAFEAQPQSSEALDLLYRIYVAQGKAEEARASFEEADEAGVLHTGARVLLGRLALYQGDRAKARETLEQVLAEEPDLPLAESSLAYVLAQEETDLDRAIELARSARRVLDEDPGAAHRLGYVYLKSGRNEAALAELSRAAELSGPRRDPSLVSPIYYHMGLALKQLDRSQEAQEAFEKALALDESFPEAEDARRQLDGIRRARS